MNRSSFTLCLVATLVSANSAPAVSQVKTDHAVAASAAKTPAIPPGPSLEETKAWIATELVSLGSYSYVTTGGKDSMVYKYEIESAVLSDCRLTLRTAVQTTYTIVEAHTYPREERIFTISLKNVNPDLLEAYTAPPPTGAWKESTPNVSVRVRAIEDRGEPFTLESAKLNERTDEVSVHVRDMEAATKVVEALRRATTLCAAMPDPPKMTNADVIQLVSAGLSEQVITTSIRNAPDKGFDLKPPGLIALKKAGVSDAIILIMQDSGGLAGGPVFTSGRARRAAEASAQAARAASAVGTFYRHGNARDYVELKADGTFELHEGRKTYLGNYRLAGRSITFTAAGPFGEYLSSSAGKTSRFLSPGDSTLIDKIVVRSNAIDDVNSATYWEKEPTASAPAAAAIANAPSAQEGTGATSQASPCADIDYLGVIQAVTGGGQMAGWNAYGGRVRNRASYAKEVDFSWVMNGRAETGTFRIPAGQFIDVNLGQGHAPPTNVRVVSCR
jgi:hypothetical protein